MDDDRLAREYLQGELELAQYQIAELKQKLYQGQGSAANSPTGFIRRKPAPGSRQR